MNNQQRHAAAQIVVPCSALDPTLKFLIDQVGFRLDMIMPADAPRIAVVSAHGLCLRLEQTGDITSLRSPVTLRLPASLKARFGQFADTQDDIAVIFDETPALELATPHVAQPIVSRLDGNANWGVGRAGMHYRDLVPGRLHGSVIASHIRIVEGGPVDDYVHYHKVGMQLIFCRRGWVRVVYEDQGEPFVMQAGDCVLQPPTIRHRVLESSAGLEVIELGSPAEHETWRDHDMTLPTPSIDRMRTFNGQRFVRNLAAQSEWLHVADGISCRDTGITAATRGAAGACVLRLAGADETPITLSSQTVAFRFVFVLHGEVELTVRVGNRITLTTDDACVLPTGTRYSMRTSMPTEVLEISFPST